jgi:hypothetical protein
MTTWDGGRRATNPASEASCVRMRCARLRVIVAEAVLLHLISGGMREVACDGGEP